MSAPTDSDGALPPATGHVGPLLLGESAVMHRALDTLRRAAAGTATVLVRGESGTGKEMAARVLHDSGARAGKPFVKVDCSALPANLLESELFGYEKGAFTGAVAQKPGRVELANSGTLFLDEIGELSPPIQAKLLRLLQDREFERLGGTKTIRANLRIVAATHRDLEAMIAKGEFREDLFYRLNVVSVWLPPLRARRSDIELLSKHFLSTLAAENGKPDFAFDAQAVRVLRAQRWPGNVRQLRNLIERLVVLCDGPVIDEKAVHSQIGSMAAQSFSTEPATDGPGAVSARIDMTSPVSSAVHPLDAEMRNAERKALLRALEKAGGNRAQAARLLGISRSTLYLKLTEHGIE